MIGSWLFYGDFCDDLAHGARRFPLVFGSWAFGEELSAVDGIGHENELLRLRLRLGDPRGEGDSKAGAWLSGWNRGISGKKGVDRGL